MHVFISYARRDQSSITQLRADFERFGHPVWFDQEHNGGQDWWDQVLRRVRDCQALVFALSPDSVRSAACVAELRYAIALRRPILAVRVRPVDNDVIPVELRGAVVEYADRTPESVIALLKAFNALPVAKPVSGRLPAPPDIPTAYLNAYLARIDADDLSDLEQDELLQQLTERLGDAQERPAVWDLLVRLRGRPGLNPLVAARMERLLAPGWQPDPRGRFDLRHWDGQSWTTLVRHGGREFNDRNSPPRTSAHLPTVLEESSTDELPVAGGKHAVAAPRTRKSLPWLVGVGVLALAGGVTGGVLWAGAGPDQESANQVARNFVDAVNTRDEAALQRFVCDRDGVENAHLYRGFLETANVTLESVEVTGTDPRFTVLAARTAGNSSVKLRIPLAEENGEWRVCDISRALSGR
ncbi:TIR domain-containing protein [Actinokineospora guangxiensis]|uniref:TIR domain-containing protein n=1 Tax=Actinokineospora guangxiensis TaxID=1490288 RepID=A0ABW0EP87_9PSEU